MRNEIIKDKEFYILSRKIDNADKCKVIEICEDCFKVKLNHNQKYDIEEAVELFSMTSKGQLYFETIVKEIDKDIISIWYPISSKYLQRREFSRITTNEEVYLVNGRSLIKAKVSDFSAGGLKLTTKEQLELLKEYQISVIVENKEIKTKFQPIRIEAVDDGFISSGRFKDISNHDRIALVQYCFRRQIENSTI